jgi:hypothetical protein
MLKNRFHSWPRRPSPAMVVALIALFIALSGVTYAAVNMPANSVGTKQIKNNAVTGQKLANDAVTSNKVRDYSLLAKDFGPGQLRPGPQGPQGQPGPQGRPGPTGATGPQGTGPAATKIVFEMSGGTSPYIRTAGVVGPWVLNVQCDQVEAAGTAMSVTVNWGPDGLLSGTLIGWTSSTATTASATPVDQPLSAGTPGFLTSVGLSQGGQITASGHYLLLPSSGTGAELLMTASVTGNTDKCSVSAAVTTVG